MRFVLCLLGEVHSKINNHYSIVNQFPHCPIDSLLIGTRMGWMEQIFADFFGLFSEKGWKRITYLYICRLLHKLVKQNLNKKVSLKYQNNEFMGALELKNDILNYIDKADERLLKVVKAVMESYWEEEIVAYTTDGKPLNKEAYKNDLKEALNEINKGEVTSQEALEKEAENW